MRRIAVSMCLTLVLLSGFTPARASHSLPADAGTAHGAVWFGSSGAPCAPSGFGVTGTGPAHYLLESGMVFTAAHGQGSMYLCGQLADPLGGYPQCLTYGGRAGEGRVEFPDSTAYRLFDVGWTTSVSTLTTWHFVMRGRYELEEHGLPTGRQGTFTAAFTFHGGCGPTFTANTFAGPIAFAEV